ncbi:MAG: aminotransferase class I/II-fold pyridoxal phosphate-dependent enzyme [Thermoleophilia bacterium]
MTEPHQTEAPLVEALRAYRKERTAAFHTPGHKLGAGAPADLVEALGERFLSADMGIANGLDDTQESGGLLRRAEELAAQAWGAERSFFVPNGSSSGLQALVMAVAGPGDEVIVPRNAHKSLLAGVILGGSLPVYVEPTLDPTWQVAVNVPLETYVAAIEAHPRARAVFATSPSYNGFCADVTGLATVAHAAGLPLVVDQAWGAHLRFSAALPLDAMAADADAAVISVHKLLAGLSQASVVFATGDRIDLDRLRTMVTMLRTTSPLAPIYLSIDAARRQMTASGEALWGKALRLAALARTRLSAIAGIAVLDGDDARQSGSVDFDPVRLTISAAGLGLSGYELERALRSDHAVAVEAADPHNIVANVTFGDSEATVERLVAAFEAISASVAASAAPSAGSNAGSDIGAVAEAHVDIDVAGSGKIAAIAAAPQLPLFTRLACSPREAFFGPSEARALRECVGRVSAEMVVPYPPGIPVLGPGEVISAETADYLAAAAVRGAFVHGPRDLSLATLRVVAPSP